MEDLKKKKVVLYFIILTFCTIVCAPLLQMHIASDTYNLMDLGYFEYPSQYFLKDARIVSTLFTYLAGILHLDYSVFIVGMEILAIIIASFSIYILYKTIGEKVLRNEKNIYDINLKNALFLMAAIIVIFNCMSLEYFLYAESAVMCLSVFLCILASRIFTKQTRHKYIKTLSILTFATFCYQGCVNIFITLVSLFLLIDKDKIDVKEIIKKFFVAGIIFVISLAINIIAIYIINILLNSEQGRIASGGILKNFSIFIPLINYIIKWTLIVNFNMWPTSITLIFIAISTILIAHTKKIIPTIGYIILVLVALLASILPVFFMKSPSIEPRAIMSIGSIIGISIIYLNYIYIEKNDVLGNIIKVITIVFFVFNTINTIQIFTAHIATNKIDANMGLTIKYKIEEYENKTGNKLTKVAYHRDDMHRDFPYGYEKKLSSFTQRAFDNYYCIIEALNYYCNRKFEKTAMEQEIYEDNFKGKNWDAYSDEQIVFKDDTMYLCTY